MLCAGFGGELFVRGAVGIARRARVSPGLVAATVAAFATSSPELAVSLTAALSGAPQIALGDALGSNVVNLALVLGLVLSAAGMRSARAEHRRDFLFAAGVPLLVGLLARDGRLSRADAAVLLVAFVLWLLTVLREARRQRAAAPDATHGGDWRTPAAALAGLLLLLAAGTLIVRGATAIALALGVDAFLIGATVVAIGTSVPEIATAAVARLRGHDEVGLGALLGSNIFNGLFVVGIAAGLAPIALVPGEIGVALVVCLLATAMAWPRHDGRLPRSRGVLLLGLYAAYLYAMLLVAP